MFVLIILVALGGINFYLYSTATNGLPEASLYFALGISFLFASLLLSITLEKAGKLRASLTFSWIGYSWLGLTTIAVPLAVITDGLQAFFLEFNDTDQTIVVGILTLLLGGYAAFSASRFKVKTVEIHSHKFPANAAPITLVQITDLHLGDSSRRRRTERVVDAINAAKPDIVVSTGDLFDGYLEFVDPSLTQLKRIEAPSGKFAVSGNHEVLAGLDRCIQRTREAGFSVLRNESTELNRCLTIAGVEDPASSRKPNEAKALEGIASTQFTILLKHRPEIDPNSIGKFDLQLSGHTHGGQIAPFHIVTKLFYSAKAGLTNIGPNQSLYLSRGTGSWGPQLRLLAPCEITVFKLLPQS